ncbi:MAG: ornithine carbamoyltransferase [Chloroflexi bacterium]|nr:MAG: ornithine carbamoyltransferase [Chloroflexota bacterium]
MRGRNVISIADLAASELERVLATALALKDAGRQPLLQGQTLALVFEKPSLRTRVSFEVAMKHLGGDCVYLSPPEVGLGDREPPADVARVLSRYVDCIAARTFTTETVQQLAEHSSVPVINALSDGEHPCQALADLLTIREKKGGLSGVTLAYIGDGNNVANSLALAGGLSGMHIRIASPKGYEVTPAILERAAAFATESGGSVSQLREPEEAASGADVVYTDVWASMGQEAEAGVRREDFAGFTVDASLMGRARPDAIFMHDLPAHRGEEVAADVIDGPQSVAFDQAENRLHAQKALLAHILSEGDVA